MVNSSVADPDPDPTFHFDADPDLLVTLMQIQIRIQLNTLMRIPMQIRILPFNLMLTRIRIHNTGQQDAHKGQDTDISRYCTLLQLLRECVLVLIRILIVLF